MLHFVDSTPLPSVAFPYLRPQCSFLNAFRFADFFFHLKPRLFYSHPFTAKFSYKFLFGGKAVELFARAVAFDDTDFAADNLFVGW